MRIGAVEAELRRRFLGIFAHFGKSRRVNRALQGAEVVQMVWTRVEMWERGRVFVASLASGGGFEGAFGLFGGW